MLISGNFITNKFNIKETHFYGLENLNKSFLPLACECFYRSHFIWRVLGIFSLREAIYDFRTMDDQHTRRSPWRTGLSPDMGLAIELIKVEEQSGNLARRKLFQTASLSCGNFHRTNPTHFACTVQLTLTVAPSHRVGKCGATSLHPIASTLRVPPPKAPPQTCNSFIRS